MSRISMGRAVINPLSNEVDHNIDYRFLFCNGRPIFKRELFPKFVIPVYIYIYVAT